MCFPLPKQTGHFLGEEKNDRSFATRPGPHVIPTGSTFCQLPQPEGGRGSQGGIFAPTTYTEPTTPRSSLPLLMTFGSHWFAAPACQRHSPPTHALREGCRCGPNAVAVALCHWLADRSLALASRYKKSPRCFALSTAASAVSPRPHRSAAHRRAQPPRPGG